jgi:hypothetical protein
MLGPVLCDDDPLHELGGRAVAKRGTQRPLGKQAEGVRKAELAQSAVAQQCRNLRVARDNPLTGPASPQRPTPAELRVRLVRVIQPVEIVEGVELRPQSASPLPCTPSSCARLSTVSSSSARGI